jgi:hypothetical protein
MPEINTNHSRNTGPHKSGAKESTNKGMICYHKTCGDLARLGLLTPPYPSWRPLWRATGTVMVRCPFLGPPARLSWHAPEPPSVAGRPDPRQGYVFCLEKARESVSLVFASCCCSPFVFNNVSGWAPWRINLTYICLRSECGTQKSLSTRAV